MKNFGMRCRTCLSRSAYTVGCAVIVSLFVYSIHISFPNSRNVFWRFIEADYKSPDSSSLPSYDPDAMDGNGRYLQAKFEKQEAERILGNLRLSNTETLETQNSDPLPDKSAFGTDFTDPQWSQKICTAYDAQRCTGKFKNVETRIAVAEKYKTASCIIQKSMSTILHSMMCYLNNETQFVKATEAITDNQLILDRAEIRRFCNDDILKYSVDSVEDSFNIDAFNREDWLFMAIVRNPLDRFLSGFVDKCVRKPASSNYCNGCKANMTCFVVSEYQRMMKNRRYRPTRTFEDRHFFPQSWRCNLRDKLDQYKFIHYSSNVSDILDQLLPLLAHQSVPQRMLSFMQKELNKDARTVHSTISTNARSFFEKRLMNSPFLLEYVIRMFYWDFVLFNFDIPILS